jgi:heavy metal sensor kinase
MLDRRSIRFRLTAWYAGILAATFLAAGAGVIYAVRNAAEETVDQDLRARLAAVREYLAARDAEHETEPLAEDLDERGAIGPAGAWLQISDDEGRWLYRSRRIQDESWGPLRKEGLPARGRTMTATVRGRPIRVLTGPAGNYVAQIGIPMGEFFEMFEKLKWSLGLATPLLLLLASAGGYWMSGRALRPVDEMARTIERIGAKSLSARLTLRGAGDELDRLAGTVNRMLARLESAFQLIAQFTADASHELRTPVAIIRTTGEVIRTRPRSGSEHEAAWDQVIAQTERMSGMIDGLLLLARADAGRLVPAHEPMDLADTVREAAAELRILAEKSGLRMTAEIPAHCAMKGDAESIRRVLMALLDNAIKYTPPGGEIDIRMTAQQESAEIAIHDTGVGIAAEDLPRIFDRFYRTSTDRSRTSGGAGLGLAIAQALAALHGGEIAAESSPGAGSTFRLRLPL